MQFFSRLGEIQQARHGVENFKSPICHIQTALKSCIFYPKGLW
jgi:hypothetical protein